MPFRNPIFLDTDLLANLADYYGADVPAEMQVTRRATSGSAKGIGVDKVLKANSDKSQTDEVTESFSVSARPVRLMNDLVDSLLADSRLIDLDASPEAPLSVGTVVQITGDLQPSAANEIGAILGRFLPLLISQVTAGKVDFQPSEAELAQMLFADSSDVDVHLFDLEPENSLEDRRHLALIDSSFLRGNAQVDDVDGEQSMVAIVDRLVRPRTELSLDRYLLPGLPRQVRRALGRKELADMVSGLDEVLGREISPDELSVTGPAVMLKPLAIF